MATVNFLNKCPSPKEAPSPFLNTKKIDLPYIIMQLIINTQKSAQI